MRASRRTGKSASRPSLPWRRTGAVKLVTAAVAAVALSACKSGSPGHIDLYRPGPGANDVTVYIPVDDPPQQVQVSLEGEDASQVRIKVELGNATPVSDKDHPVIGVGTTVTRTVTLKAPLGSRHVVNADGSTAIPSPDFTP